jgi:hypothetical protein
MRSAPRRDVQTTTARRATSMGISSTWQSVGLDRHEVGCNERSVLHLQYRSGNDAMPVGYCTPSSVVNPVMRLAGSVRQTVGPHQSSGGLKNVVIDSSRLFHPWTCICCISPPDTEEMRKHCGSNPCAADASGFWRPLASQPNGTSFGVHVERSYSKQRYGYAHAQTYRDARSMSEGFPP